MSTQTGSHRHTVLALWLLGIAFLAVACTAVILVLLQPPTTSQSAQILPPVSEKSAYLVHPVFGEAHKTVAVDEQLKAPSFLAQILSNIGLRAAQAPMPKRTNLLIGETPMLWSSAGNAGGYLYCHLLSSREMIWQFAPCNRTNLGEVMPVDFLTTFVSTGDNKNGVAAFGTNWLKHDVRVRQGQILLARLVSDAAQVYAF
jgi:hypothetical protein